MRRHLLYGSYTDKSTETQQTGAGQRRERVRNILVILLVVIIAAMGVFGGQAIAYRSEARTQLVAIMQAECRDAVSQTNTLSRTAGANSAATLGRIRSCVHAMDTVNTLRAGLERGRYFLPVETFTALYATLDNYSSRLLTGMNTGDLQGELEQELIALQDIVNQW